MAHYKVIFLAGNKHKVRFGNQRRIWEEVNDEFCKNDKRMSASFLTQKGHKCRTYFGVSQICTAENMLQ